MDFYRESSPPPAYSEQDYDKKIATAIELSLIAEEREEEDESRSEVAAVSSRARECASTRNYAAQINPPPSANPRSVRRLPAPPGAGVADNKPLRVHARSASHSYGSSPVSNPPKPRPKWHGDLAEDVSSTMTLSRITATSPHNRDHGSSSPPPAFSTVPPPPSSSHSPTVSRYTNSSSLPQHHFSGPKNDSTPLSHSFPSRNGSHTRAVSQLNFDSSVAYSRSGFSPVSAGSSHSDSSQNNTFNPNSFYNSAVSSQLHASPSPHVPARLNKPHAHPSRSTPNNHFTTARPSQASVYIPQRAQSPSIPYSTNATQFPLHPSYNPTTSPTASSHDRWATSENQFVQT